MYVPWQLNGCSEDDAHVWSEIGNFICLIHSTSTTTPTVEEKNPVSPHSCAIFYELQCGNMVLDGNSEHA